MNLKQKIIGVLFAIVAILGGGYTAANLGGVVDGQADIATTTYNVLGRTTFTTSQTLKYNMGGVLSKVVITGAVAGSLKFQDATSTTDLSSTTIAVFPASAAAGEYELNATFTRGLVVHTLPGLVPTTTITFR